MRRALVLSAHPCEESYSAALHKTVVQTLAQNDWEVDDCDLYAENFQPVLTAEERRGYHDIPDNIEAVRPYVERVRAAGALVLVFPVWNFGYPAILKGFFDRVFLPDVSFKLVDGEVRPNLTNIQRLAAVTTYGGTRLRAIGAGDPPRRIVTRALAYTCQPIKTQYLALYDMNRADALKRGNFHDHVRAQMERL